MIIYNQNFAVCEEMRETEVPSGKTEIIFSDIPKFIEPASIQISFLDFPSNFIILEQVFVSDIFNLEKLFSKNIGEKIEIISKMGEVYSGNLLFYDGRNLTIEAKDKILVLNREDLKEIRFPKIEAIDLKPKLKFLIQSEKKGYYKILLKYITSNINWKADYIGEFNEAKNKLQLTGLITIENKSGLDYKNVSLVLIAGEVKKITGSTSLRKFDLSAVGVREESKGFFEESPVFEYYKYLLKGKTDINEGEVKQIKFISESDIKVEKKYVYIGNIQTYYHYDNWRNLPYNEKVEVIIEFKNEKEPLPSGKIRIFKTEKEGSFFIGEDTISHVPSGEKVKLSLGNAFDIKGERKIISHEKITANFYKDTYEIKIKNFKDSDIIVEVIEKLYGTWDIIEKTHNYEKIDAYTVKFPVKVKAKDETILRYTVTTKF